MFGSIIREGFDSYELEQVAKAFNEPALLTAQDCDAINQACTRADKKAQEIWSIPVR